MRPTLRCVLWFILLLLPLASGAQLPGSPFAVVAGGEEAPVQAGTTAILTVRFTVPAHHYIYADKTDLQFLQLAAFDLEGLDFPAAVSKVDPFLGHEVAIYDRDLVLTARLRVPADTPNGPHTITAQAQWQGCSQSICYRLETFPLSWVVTVVGGSEVSAVPATPPASNAARGDWWAWFRDLRAETLFAHGVLLTYLLTFLGGFLTAFTPCVLPLIPVILLIIGVHPGEHRRNAWLSTCLAAGLALTYASIGLIGALIGLPIGFLFQQPWFVVLVILFFVGMAASMFGLFSLRLPGAWQLRLQRLGGVGPTGAFLAGISTGILATPCAGPVVAALVGYVGTQQDLVLGFTLLFTYGAGLGLLFIAVGTFYGRLAQRLPKGGKVRLVKAVLGILLLLPAAYYTWALVSPARWQIDEDAAFAQAQARALPVLIEFTAKTCLPCLEMERTTFQDKRVQQALADEIIPLRVDTTFLNDTVRSLIERYHVVGWPTLLFVTPDGEVITDLSLVGQVVSADRLLEQIHAARIRVAH